MIKIFKNIAIVLLLISWSCSKDEDFVALYDVEPEYESMVELFVQEAASRGVVLTINNLILKSDDNLDPELCGLCNSLGDPAQLQKEVTINRGRGCWENPQELEALVFHELGHCVLGRGHLTDTLPNGDPKSMMINANLTVYAPCRYVFGQAEDCNNVHKRDYYLDELFDPNTAVPDWAK